MTSAAIKPLTPAERRPYRAKNVAFGSENGTFPTHVADGV